MSVRSIGSARAAAPPNNTNSIVQRAFGRTVAGNVITQCRLTFQPNIGNDLLCLYAGYQNGYSGIPAKATTLLAPNSDANNQAVYAFYSTATTASLGVNSATNTGDTANAAIYELNGLKTRTATHGAGTISGSTYSVPFPSAPATTTFLLLVEWDNGALMTSFTPAGVSFDSSFSAAELGNAFHTAHAFQFSGTGAAGNVVLTCDIAPVNAMFMLISLAP